MKPASRLALSQEEIAARIKFLPQDWLYDKVSNKLVFERKFVDFNLALSYLNEIAKIADKLDHHPDVVLRWGYLKLELWTHSANAVTDLDFEFAAKAGHLG